MIIKVNDLDNLNRFQKKGKEKKNMREKMNYIKMFTEFIRDDA